MLNLIFWYRIFEMLFLCCTFFSVAYEFVNDYLNPLLVAIAVEYMRLVMLPLVIYVVLQGLQGLRYNGQQQPYIQKDSARARKERKGNKIKKRK